MVREGVAFLSKFLQIDSSNRHMTAHLGHILPLLILSPLNIKRKHLLPNRPRFLQLNQQPVSPILLLMVRTQPNQPRRHQIIQILLICHQKEGKVVRSAQAATAAARSRRGGGGVSAARQAELVEGVVAVDVALAVVVVVETWVKFEGFRFLLVIFRLIE